MRDRSKIEYLFMLAWIAIAIQVLMIAIFNK